MSTFGDGVYQFGGSPAGIDIFTTKVFHNKSASKGRAWFVDTVHGTNGSGRSPKDAFTTMDAAFDVINSGDIIYFVGDVREQLVTPAQVFDVTVVGCGNRPRHADSAPTGGAYAASTWRAPASGGTAAQATVRVIQQGWRFINILFAAVDSNAAMIEVVRNSASGNSERDASHAEIIGCRFAGAGIGIRVGATSFAENVFNVLVQDCTFSDNTTAIDSSGGLAYRWQVLNNTFIDNATHIDVGFTEAVIKGNVFGLTTSVGVDLTGGTNNVVTGNYFHGDFNVLNTAGTTDMWAGNFAEETGGVTDADPTGS